MKTKKLNVNTIYTNSKKKIDINAINKIVTQKIDKKFVNLIKEFQSKDLPSMPVGAKFLMENYQIQEGKRLGNKLKIIEEEWVNNNFKLSKKQIDKIVNR